MLRWSPMSNGGAGGAADLRLVDGQLADGNYDEALAG